MLKPNQNVYVKWNSANRKHYVNKGYIFTKWKDEFLVKVEDLSIGSHSKVKVICDYCHCEKDVSFKDYIRCHDGEFGDCCYNCTKPKRELVLMRDYGVPCYWQTKECKDKIEKVCLEKYGVKYYTMTQEFIEKSNETYFKNGTQKTSRQQILVYELLKDRYDICKLNYPCDYYALDCFIEVNGVKIDVEYDGYYWHKSKQSSDNKRDGYMFSKGIKVLRIKGRYKIPTIEQIESAIQTILDGNRYQEIILDW